MIDRTLLTEALADIEALATRATFQRAFGNGTLQRLNTVTGAARLLLDFPTDEQVEAAMVGRRAAGALSERERMEGALEAVRDTMIGDNQE